MKGDNIDKIALVTGASSGLGKCITHLLISKGWEVIGIARREEKLVSLKNEGFGDHFHYYQCDVSSKKQVIETCEKIKKSKLIPNLFILNAGQLLNEHDIDSSLHEKTFKVNYFGNIYFLEQWVNYCLDKNTIFVGISSLAAKQSMPNLSAYCASKAALSSAFDAFRIQYHNSKIKFVTVFPGPIQTDLINSQNSSYYIQKPMDAAQHIIEKVLSGKQKIAFPLIYKVLTTLSKITPTFIIRKFFNSYSLIFDKNKEKKG